MSNVISCNALRLVRVDPDSAIGSDCDPDTDTADTDTDTATGDGSGDDDDIWGDEDEPEATASESIFSKMERVRAELERDLGFDKFLEA